MFLLPKCMLRCPWLQCIMQGVQPRQGGYSTHTCACCMQLQAALLGGPLTAFQAPWVGLAVVVPGSELVCSCPLRVLCVLHCCWWRSRMRVHVLQCREGLGLAGCAGGTGGTPGLTPAEDCSLSLSPC